MAVRIGFVGAGGVAARHAAILAGFPDVELVGVVDPDTERATSFAAAHRIRADPTLGELLRNGVDAVYVCVPPFAHGEPEAAAAACGAAVFVEKPLALDVGVAEVVAAQLAAAGVATAVGHHWRYAATVRMAARVLEGRALRLVSGSWLDKVPPVPWWSRLDLSGGQLVEQAVHVLDLARLLAGEVAEVHAIADARPPTDEEGADLDGASAAILRFSSGAVGTLAATCGLSWKHRAGLEICADDLVLGVGEDWLEVRDPGEARRYTVDPDEAKVAADRAFIDAVLGRPAEVVDYAEALRSHRLACALAASVTAGQPMTLGGGDG